MWIISKEGAKRREYMLKATVSLNYEQKLTSIIECYWTFMTYVQKLWKQKVLSYVMLVGRSNRKQRGITVLDFHPPALENCLQGGSSSSRKDIIVMEIKNRPKNFSYGIILLPFLWWMLLFLNMYNTSIKRWEMLFTLWKKIFIICSLTWILYTPHLLHYHNIRIFFIIVHCNSA